MVPVNDFKIAEITEVSSSGRRWSPALFVISPSGSPVVEV